jgi:hypothetical protein
MHSRLIVLSVLPLALLSGCFYTHSSYQSARLLEQGQVELVPYYQAETYHFPGVDGWYDSGEVKGSQYGLLLGFGASNQVNLRARIERSAPDGMEAYDYIGFGPKFGKTDGLVALDCPLGMVFGKEINEDRSLQIHPTGLLRIPLAPRVDLNAYAKLVYFFEADIDPLYSLGLGAGILLPGDRISLRPEVSFIKGFDGGDSQSSIGLGIAWLLPGKTASGAE